MSGHISESLYFCMSEFPEVPVCVDTDVLSVHLHACICMHSLHVHIQEYAGLCVFTYVYLHTSPREVRARYGETAFCLVMSAIDDVTSRNTRMMHELLDMAKFRTHSTIP